MDRSFVRPMLREGRVRVAESPMWFVTDDELADLKAALADQSLSIAGRFWDRSTSRFVRCISFIVSRGERSIMNRRRS